MFLFSVIARYFGFVCKASKFSPIRVFASELSNSTGRLVRLLWPFLQPTTCAGLPASENERAKLLAHLALGARALACESQKLKLHLKAAEEASATFHVGPTVYYCCQWKLAALVAKWLQAPLPFAGCLHLPELRLAVRRGDSALLCSGPAPPPPPVASLAARTRQRRSVRSSARSY